MAAVAGCRIDSLVRPQHTAPPDARAPQEQPLPALPGRGEASAEPVEPASTGAPPTPPEPEQEASLDINPDSLLGLDRKSVRALLGRPSFIRREKPMELWRYRHGGCALALFLYGDTAGGADSFRVRHVESWAPGGAETPPGACLNALARRARQQPTG